MPKLKEKFFNKPDTLTQEKKSLGEAIKSGGMLKSARRKKGVKTDTEKEALIESMMGGGKRRAAGRAGRRGRRAGTAAAPQSSCCAAAAAQR